MFREYLSSTILHGLGSIYGTDIEQAGQSVSVHTAMNPQFIFQMDMFMAFLKGYNRQLFFLFFSSQLIVLLLITLLRDFQYFAISR